MSAATSLNHSARRRWTARTAVLSIILSALAVALTGIVAAPAANAGYIKSIAADKYVSGEFAYPGDNYGMLRARATVFGLPESWDVQRISTCEGPPNTICRIVTFTSTANHRYVTAELGYTGDRYGMLRASSTWASPWTRFRVLYYGSNTWALQSEANGMYVSAELGYTGDRYGMLRARATEVRSWEKFVFG
jgi:hypothetical protein